MPIPSFPRSDPRSAVYPLNVPRTCGNCHGNDGMAKKHGLASVYPLYVDSIHGFALSKEGLLVAANCQSCHGSHHILSRKDPQSPTNKVNIPKTCGTCHAGITNDYYGRRTWQGRCERPSGCAGVLRLPHRALHRTAHGGCVPYAVHADLRKLSQGQVHHLPGHFPLAVGLVGRLCRNGPLLGLPRGARHSARIRSRLTCGSGQPGENLRQVPCGRQRQLCPVSAPCQCAQSQAEPGALLCPAVHESAAGQSTDVLRDSHHSVAYSLAIPPD